MFEINDRFGHGDDAGPHRRTRGLGRHRFALDGVGLWLDGTAKPPAAAAAVEDPYRDLRELCGLGY